MNELKASPVGISLFLNNFSFDKFKLNLYTDNIAFLYFLRKGRCHWQVPIYTLFKLLFFVNQRFKPLDVKYYYIPSAFNKADKLSRCRSIAELT